MKNYVVSYGYEIEWGDIDRKIDIPAHLGSWEGPKLPSGYYAGAERDINNSDGTLADPICETTHLGGEINVHPSNSIDDIIEKIVEIKKLFSKPYAGIVNHGHLHVYAPKINLDKLKQYTAEFEAELIECCYDVGSVRRLYLNNQIDLDTFKYLMYDGGRVNSFVDGKNSLEFDTKEETTSPRAAVNIWNLTNNKTIEFRCFRSTTDISLIRNCFILATHFINNSQLEYSEQLSPSEIIERYNLEFPPLPTDVIIKNFIADRHPKERGDPYKYMENNTHRWIEPLDLSCLEEVKQTLQKKGQDYGNMSSELYIKERTTANIYNKAARLCNMIFGKNDPNFESVEDTVKDMIGYCILFLNNWNRK